VARKGKKTETENDSTEMEHFPIVIRNTFTHRRNQTPWRKVETEKNGGRNETIEAQPYSTQEDSEREREIDKKKEKKKGSTVQRQAFLWPRTTYNRSQQSRTARSLTGQRPIVRIIRWVK